MVLPNVANATLRQAFTTRFLNPVIPAKAGIQNLKELKQTVQSLTQTSV